MASNRMVGTACGEGLVSFIPFDRKLLSSVVSSGADCCASCALFAAFFDPCVENLDSSSRLVDHGVSDVFSCLDWNRPNFNCSIDNS